MKNRYLLGIIFVIVLIGVIYSFSENLNYKQTKFLNVPVLVYQSQNCGCCQVYVRYLKSHGFKVRVINIEDNDLMKFKLDNKIPYDMVSCHTALINDYIVEGHIPVEAIEKLLIEKPDIKGITLPGMPSGSPGMPGFKLSPFKIYSITKNGENGGVFTEI